MPSYKKNLQYLFNTSYENKLANNPMKLWML